MNNRNLWLFYFFTFILISSCSKDNEDILPESEQSEYELEVISYFKEVALGFENGNSSEITRKWQSPMRVFLDGNPSSLINDKVKQSVNEINELVTDGFLIEIVNDYNLSNCYVFFGTASDFIEKFPDADGQIGSNYALFNVWWNNNIINRARIFIDTNRPNLKQQESIIVEEITQSLGLGKDSPRYPNSIFYETPNNGGFATEYANIDKDLIRLLYHPKMSVGLNENQVDEVLREILTSE